MVGFSFYAIDCLNRDLGRLEGLRKTYYKITKMFKDKTFRNAIILMIIAFILICFFPYIFTKFSIINLGTRTSTDIADTLNGIMSPFIAFVAVGLTFLAFWVQYKANQRQFKEFDEQRKDTSIGRFENRFYELLKIHRDNVSEFQITRFDNPENFIIARRVFVSMLDELRFSYFFTLEAYRDLNEEELSEKSEKTNYSEEDLYAVAYVVFFNGISDSLLTALDASENRALHYVLGEKFKPLLLILIPKLNNIRDRYKRSESISASVLYKSPFGIIKNEQKLKIKYLPFSGHNSRLGHYYRHLFQMVKFIVGQDEKVIGDRYGYIKTLRAQLSNYEQILLYYNAISPFGKPWMTNKYLTEWRMIKNMPVPLADFGPQPKDVLGEKNSKGKRIFEWDEIPERLVK